MQDAGDIIRSLGLEPHPEGGWYRETWRAVAPEGVRPSGTAIHFLLEADQRSHWHRVDATEIWLWHAGHPLTLSIDDTDHVLGPDLAAGEAPQLIVPAGAWQAAVPLGGWVLVSCIVSPGFDFAGFDLAPPGWVPPGRSPE
ncbi:cupin domain-containing protein [Oceanicella sp. SM1341]|uniref:cupin domain-containing protein n=1 Tax=Oceanicella sp. SM1341 TaxID=1548889 RepID=UPI000E52EB1C|nr:cupin domain-containing protein [Oceanicella sp. SM1341]